MQNFSRKQKLAILIGVLLGIILVVVMIIAALNKTNKNQFGEYITIQNYDQKVKNVSSGVKDAIQTSLYKIVKKNSADTFNASTVGDATIRESSDSQKYDASKLVYSGNFIVDIASIKQSYQAQYSYSPSNTIDVGGSPVVLSCPSTDKLKYGDFNCKDAFSNQVDQVDAIMQYLPYENFDFKISPDATIPGQALTLVVQLRIPNSALAGNATSKAAAITLYKKEVTDWIQSKSLDPSRFTIMYDYSDAGDYIGPSQANLD